jgi:LytS/YehU family sensor histidine kinase
MSRQNIEALIGIIIAVLFVIFGIWIAPGIKLVYRIFVTLCAIALGYVAWIIYGKIIDRRKKAEEKERTKKAAQQLAIFNACYHYSFDDCESPNTIYQKVSQYFRDRMEFDKCLIEMRQNHLIIDMGFGGACYRQARPEESK